MDCIIFLTHNFTNEFLNTLSKVNSDANVKKYDIIVLFDNNNDYDNSINNKFKNIKIIKINRINSSYDKLGHTMYLNYFKINYECISKYRYIWIIENDVYYPKSFINFIEIHNVYDHDLLVSEYGLRTPQWSCNNVLKGFKNNQKIGVLAVIIRFSQKMLLKLIDKIDKEYFGFLEAILPHICLENNLTIQQFLPEKCGILTTDKNLPLLKIISMDIVNNTRKYLEDKIYHPIKL